MAFEKKRAVSEKKILIRNKNEVYC